MVLFRGFIGCIKLVLLHSRYFLSGSLYRPQKVLNSDVLVSIGLLLCVSLTLVLVEKACQKTMLVFYSTFSQVFMTTESVFYDETVLVYLM